MSLEFVNVKEELEFEVDVIDGGPEGPGEKSHIVHEVKSEPGIRHDLPQVPNVSSMFQGVTEENPFVPAQQLLQDTIKCDIKLLKSCYVKLEHLAIRKELLAKVMKANPRKLLFVCDICDNMFQLRYQLKRHEATHVKQLLHVNKESVAVHFGFIIEEDEHVNCGYLMYNCDICIREFKNESDFNNHMQIHEQLQNMTLSKQNENNLRKQLYPKRSMTECYGHFENTEEIPNFCITCGIVVRATLDGFAKHIVPHLDENPVLKQILKDLTLAYHKGLRPVRLNCYDPAKQKIYDCHLCSNMFIRRRAYNKHMEAHANGKLECEICHDTFPTLETLLQHKYKHNDQSFPPISLEAYSVKKPSELYSTVHPIETIPTSHKQSSEPTNPTGASDQGKTSDLKSSDESIDFQKSSLFSRLKLLNQTLKSNVVGKSSNCPN